MGQGSGFIVSTDGKVVTNYHVIDGADSAMVKLSDGGIYVVEGIVGADKDKDVAVLKLKASGREFPFLPRGDPGQLKVGDEVVAIGVSLGLEGTVSTGVISAKRGSPGSEMEVLQITAPISPGSSGGALLNSKGEVIGVPFVQTVSGQNLNFAIPITYVSPLILDAPAKPFPSVPQPVVAKKAPSRHRSPLPTEQSPQVAKTAAVEPSELNGTYTGIWQSKDQQANIKRKNAMYSTLGNSVGINAFDIIPYCQPRIYVRVEEAADCDGSDCGCAVHDAEGELEQLPPHFHMIVLGKIPDVGTLLRNGWRTAGKCL